MRKELDRLQQLPKQELVSELKNTNETKLRALCIVAGLMRQKPNTESK